MLRLDDRSVGEEGSSCDDAVAEVNYFRNKALSNMGAVVDQVEALYRMNDVLA
jgi:hypothetical protein